MLAKINFKIETNRLNFKLLSLDDVSDVYEYACDPLVAENTSWLPHKSMEDTQAFVQYAVSKHSLIPGKLRLVWGIRIKASSKVIGTLSFIQDNEKEGHVDYALSRSYWGKGYMTETVSSLVSWAFNNLPTLIKINSGCLSRNIGSVKVLEKSGFAVTERFHSERGSKFDNQILETTLFCLSRQNWPRN